MQVKELMKQPYVVDKDVSLVDAAKLMSAKNVGSLLYVARGKAKGIITESDLLKNFGKQGKISQIMSKKIVSIMPEEPIDAALKLMKENNIRRLPVVDVNKSLVGIISMTDIAANVDKMDGDFFFN